MSGTARSSKRIEAKQGLVLWLTLLAVFAFSQIAYSRAGVIFDMSPLGWFMQFLDPQLLKNNLAQSLFYLHVQPPLFNLFLGLVLKMFSEHAATAFRCIYLALGFLLSTSMFLLLEKLSVRRPLALSITLLAMISPAFVLYENLLSYEIPVMCALCLSALALFSYLRSDNRLSLHAFFWLLAAIILSRSVFHIVWLLACVGLVLVARKNAWRSIVFSAALPLLLTVGWYARSACMFGSFTSSTWLGMNLGKMSTSRIPFAEREVLVKQGVLSPMALISPFSPIREYDKYCRLDPAVTRYQAEQPAALFQQVKSTGNQNYNHIELLAAAKLYQKDALWVIRTHPQAYLKAVLGACFLYCLPAEDCYFVDRNLYQVQHLDSAWSLLFFGQAPHKPISTVEEYDAFIQMRGSKLGVDEPVLGRKTVADISRVLLPRCAWFLISLLPALTIYGLILCRQAWQENRSPAFWTMLFMVGTIIYVTMVAVLVDVGGNNRTRLMIDPFFLVLLGVAASNIADRLKSRQASAALPTEAVSPASAASDLGQMVHDD